MTHPSLAPEAVQFVDQMSTLIATSGRVHTTHQLTELAPPRVLSWPCDWGTCTPRYVGQTEPPPPSFVAEWHDRVANTHMVHVRRTAAEVGHVLSYLVAVGHLKLVTVTGDTREYKAWLWVGPVPVSADRLEQMWSLS
jgi:hypothetical protein